MNNSDKPKRKRQDAANPALFLVAGLIIGAIVTALGIAGFFFIGTARTVQTPVIMATPTYGATVTPQAQVMQIQPTVIASRIHSAKISPDGRFLATIVQAEGQTSIYLAQLRVERNLTNLQRVTLHQEIGYFNDVIFSPSGDKLVATSDDTHTLIFDTTTHEILETLSPYSHAAFSPDGIMLALAGNADGLRVLNTGDFSLLQSRQLDDPFIGGLAFNQANQLAVATQHLQVWNPFDLNEVPNPYAIDLPTYDIAFHPDGEWIAVAAEGTVSVINITNSERKLYTFETRQILSVAFSVDGEWLAVGGGNSGMGIGKIYAFRWNQSDVIPPDPTFYEVREFSGNNHTVFDVSFAGDGLLLSASWDGSVRLWDVETGEEISRLQL